MIQPPSNQTVAPLEHAVDAPHAAPGWILIAVYAALVILTGLTVAAAGINLGQFNILVALVIAAIKAALVVLFFMHLFWDSPFNGIVLICALLCVAIFISFAVMDTTSYNPSLTAPQSVQIGQ